MQGVCCSVYLDSRFEGELRDICPVVDINVPASQGQGTPSRTVALFP
jgi:hypothetical protein